MEPIKETVHAVEEYGPFATDEGDLLDELRDSAERVRELVPECVGLTLSSTRDGVSFTLVASDEEMAVLDAIQYAVGGPCVESVRAERVLSYTQDDFLAEEDWQLFARATAAASIASTLTLPILVEERVAGSINLYAATPGAFTGRHEQIAEIFDAWAPGAVANADLDFSTRAVAEQAPRVLRDQLRIQVALGILMRNQDIDIETARTRLVDAAQRAGATVVMVAETLVSGAKYGDRDGGE
jgi:GAF domain-containing protein